MGLFSNPKQGGTATLTSASGPEIEGILREMGFGPELTTDSKGDPKILFGVEGIRCLVFFYEVKDGRAGSIQFCSGFSDKLTPATANEWNRGKRFLKVYLDEDSEPYVDMDVDLAGGVTREYIMERVKLWKSLLLNFIRFVRESR